MSTKEKFPNTYWNGKGKFQKVYDRLYKKLVPAEGEASTKHGELLRQISKIYYDVYNNGLCNADVIGQNAIDTFEEYKELIKNQLDRESDYDVVIKVIKNTIAVQSDTSIEDDLYNDIRLDSDIRIDDIINSGSLECFTDAVIEVVTAYNKGYIK